MTALERLFNSDEPKKNADVTSESKGTPVPAPTEKGKKVCTACEEEVWAIHTRDGVCKDCRTSKKAPVEPPTQETSESTPETPTTPEEATKTETKSAGQLEGLKSDKWHDDPATFNQTSFLKKHTGLKTWDLQDKHGDLVSISKLQASEMISAIREDTANIPRVSEILVTKFGCEKYVRPNGKVKKEADQEVVDADTVDLAAILAEVEKLKASNRALKAANTRMSKAS